MTSELTALSLACILGLIHIFAAVHVKTRQYGRKWNAGARDEMLEAPAAIVGRLARAQANFFESFPIFIAAVLIVTALGLEDSWTTLGAWLWFAARALYLPTYAAGIANVRTLIWLASVFGLLMLLVRPLFG